MNRNWIAGILAGAALTGALGLGIARNARNVAAPDGPEATIYSMMDAARAGDAARYLDYYAGPALATLRQAETESGAAAFAQSLRETNAAIAGVVTGDAEFTGAIAKVRVEYVYRERNAVQNVYLERIRGRWRVVRTEEEDRAQMPVPYGSLVK